MLSRSRKLLLFLTVAILFAALCSILSVPIFLSKSTTGSAESTEHEPVSTGASLTTTKTATSKMSTKDPATSDPATSSSSTTSTSTMSSSATSSSTVSSSSNSSSTTSSSTAPSTTEPSTSTTLPSSPTMTTTTTPVLTTTKISSCEGFTCSNNGTCIFDDDKQQAECVCNEPYFGERCEKHRCDDHICQNNGTCYFHEVLQRPKCDCEVSYSGKNCECPPVYQKQKGHLGNLKKIGYAAKEHCSDLGGHLMFFLNKEELDDFSNNYRENSEHEWVGYTQKFSDDKDLYMTVDGEDARFLNWETEKSTAPDSKDEQCVELYGHTTAWGTKDHMNDKHCWEEREFSCRLSQHGICPR